MVELASNAFCSVGDVKRYAQFDTAGTGSNDAFFAAMINAFSAHAERVCGRAFEYSSRTEFHDGAEGAFGQLPRRELFLKAPPVDAGASFAVYDDPDLAFGASTLLTKDSDYVVNTALGLVTRLAGANFTAGTQSVKVVYTGGLVRARAVSPAAPALSLSAGALTGIYQWALTHEQGGRESLLGAVAEDDLDSEQGSLTFTDPGPGVTVHVYRNKAGGSVFYRVTSVAGVTLNASLNVADNTPDLDLGEQAPEEGPAEVPGDLKEACAAQVVEWTNRRARPGVSMFTGTGTGQVVYPRREDALLPWVNEVLRAYRR